MSFPTEELVPPGASAAQTHSRQHSGPRAHGCQHSRLEARLPLSEALPCFPPTVCSPYSWKVPPRRESEPRVTRGPQNRNKRRSDSKLPRSQRTQIRQKKISPLTTIASRISRLLLVRPGLVPFKECLALLGGRKL